jgi:hypothetical protein
VQSDTSLRTDECTVPFQSCSEPDFTQAPPFGIVFGSEDGDSI